MTLAGALTLVLGETAAARFLWRGRMWILDVAVALIAFAAIVTQ